MPMRMNKMLTAKYITDNILVFTISESGPCYFNRIKDIKKTTMISNKCIYGFEAGERLSS